MTTSHTGSALEEVYIVRTGRGKALEELLRFYNFDFFRTQIGADRLSAYEEDGRALQKQTT